MPTKDMVISPFKRKFGFPHALRFAAVLLSCGACAGGASPKPSAAPKPVASELERYFPLEHNSVLSFVTYSESSNEQGILVIEIMRPRPDLVELRVAGRTQRLQLEAGGIKSSDGGYLLKSPLAKDATFPGSFGPVVIKSIDKTIKVPAGEFKSCIETVEEANLETARKTTTTVYCPGVGITMRQTEAATSQDTVFERMELKSFGPRFGGEASK